MKVSLQGLFRNIKKAVAVALVLAVLFGIAVMPAGAEESPASDSEIYGMLYYADTGKLNTDGTISASKNIELVLQKGNQPDPAKELVKDSDGKKGIVQFSKADAYPSWYRFAPTSNNYNIISVDFKDKLQPSSIAGWFRNCKLLTEDSFKHKENLDTTECTDMQYAFYLCSGMKKIDFKDWTNFKAENVRKLGYFLSDCTSLETADLTTLHPGKCTEAPYFFKNCYALEKVKLNNFNITENNGEKKTYMNNFFAGCRKLETVGNSSEDSVDLSQFKAPYPMSYDSMFRGCTSLRKADLSALGAINTNNAVYISNMFYDCTSLEEIDMSNFKIEFSPRNFLVNARALRELKVPDVTKTNNLGKNESRAIFQYAEKLAYVELSKNWVVHGSLQYLPANQTWKKTKLSNNLGSTDQEPINTEKSAEDLFKNFKPSYAGGWSAEADFDFKGNGGMPESQTVTGEKNKPLNTDSVKEPTREGYTFDGWYSEPDGGEQFNGTAKHWTYYAHWNDIEYTLVLDANGGHKEGSNETQISQTVKYSDWVELGKTGFVNGSKVLVGWNTNAIGTGVSYSALDSVGMLNPKAGTFTLYAIWGDNAATVSFDSHGGSAVSTINYSQLPANYSVLSISEKAHYTFMGWFTAEEGGEKIEENSPVTQSCTLHAQWMENPIVQLDPNGGYFVNGNTTTTTPEIRECAYNGTVGYLTVPSNGNASLLGWFTERTGGEKITSETIVDSDRTYYAHWGYMPVLDTDGGILQGEFSGFPAAETADNYKIAELPEYPDISRENYTFDGWYHGDTKVSAGSEIDLTDNKIIKARWTRKQTVTITLDPDGGQMPDGAESSITVYQLKPVAALPTPVKDGYDFDGWFQSGSEERVTANTVILSDTTLTARWTQRDCAVTFHPGKGTLLGDEVVHVPAGRVLTYIPGVYNPAVGETFLGWFTGQNGQGSKLTPETVINGDTDFYPHWASKIIPDTDTGVNFMAQWDTGSDSNVTDTGDYLVFHPNNNNQVTATIKVVLMMEGNLTQAVPVGALKLKIPKHVFEDYAGNPVGADNIATMASDKYERLTDEGDYYVFTNKVDIRSDFDTFTIDYTVTPRQVKGGYEDENRRFAGNYYKNDNIKVILEIDKSSYKLADRTIEQTLGLEFHTLVHTNASKSRSNVTLDWNESWGERPVDADEYFYVTWALISDHSNTSAQRYKLMWDEDTAGREGTIVYTSGAVGYQTGWRNSGRSTAYVVTKHRRDSATAATVNGDIWVPVENEAVLNVEWESGHKEQFRVNATATAYIPPSGSGAYSLTKTVPNANNNQAHYIHGGQELILNGEADNMPKLPYEIKYTENYNVDDPSWSAPITYRAPKRTMTIVDCAGDEPGTNDVMISTNDGDFSKDSWAQGSSYGLVDGDYYFDKLTINITEYDAKKIGEHWSNPYEHNSRSDYDPTHVYIRKQNETEFKLHLSQQVPKEGWTVTLPADTVGFKVVHSTTAYTANISVKTNVCLKPTSRLQQFVAAAVNDGNYTIIKNQAHINVQPEGRDARNIHTANNSAWAASYVLDMSSIHLYARKDCADNDSDVIHDPDTQSESFPAVISGWNYNNSGNKTPFRTGEFYDLLPKDYSVDKDTIFIKPIKENWSESYYNNTAKIKANKYESEKKSGGALPKGAYSVRFVENWENTGRTMMIVQVSVPDSIIATGVNVFYKMKIRYASIYENGVTQNNIVAFRDTTKGQIAPESKSTGIDEGDIPAELIPLFAGFDGKNTAFASDNTHTIQPLIREAGLSSAVYTEESGMSEHEVVGLNSNYSYHIAYRSGAGARCRDLVFYNVLEHRIDGAESEWSGKFLGVDVSAIEAVTNGENANAKCAPVVYYSIAPKNSFIKKPFGDESDSFNLDPNVNPDLWTTTPPEDISTVTAIAVDCRTDNKGKDFYLAPEQMLDFKINMKSISDKSRNDIYAYNESVIRFDLPDTHDRGHLLSKTDVLLHFKTPLLDKTAFPSSGTEAAPASVVRNSIINYTLKITNPDSTVTMNDIVVTDSFDSALVSVNPENITVRLGDEADALIEKHARITRYSADTSHFNATIGTLEPGETLYITIPVTVSKDAVDKSVITNTAQITSVNGVAFDVQSPTTYHIVDTLKLKIMKVNSKGEPLEGATLKILNSNGTEAVAEFTSGTEPTVISINKGSYILRETGTPDGYKTADDISFRVASDGRVYINDTVYDSVTMVNEPAFKVIFHENHQEQSDKNVVFRIFEPQDLTNSMVKHFYDIPSFAGDEYVFAGWYHNSGYTQTDSPDSAELTPADFEHDEFTAANTSSENDPDYHLYAKWIKVGKVNRDAADTNIFSGGYRGFGLAGVQIRQEKGPDGEEMYDPNVRDEGIGGEEYNNSGKKTPAGLRFVTSLSESLLAGIHDIRKINSASTEAKSFGVEYGYAVGLAEDISEFVSHYNADPSEYRLQYQGENVNGVDTTGKDKKPETDYRYISNVNCTSKQTTTEKTGVVMWDHRNYNAYRLYTLVVTYEGAESEKSKKLNARAYIRYYDANGKLRVFYNSYRDNMYYGGCMCSFSQVAG